MARRVGENVQRSLLGGNASNKIGGDLERVRQRGASPTLQKAVVLDVITDPDLLTEEELDNLANTVNNPELIDVMPINSILARVVSNAGGVGPQNNTILFPFFSSHIMLPISPGETVYVIYEDYQDTGAAIGYWFTRISSQKTIEDVNYTHFDRKFDATTNPTNYSTEERSRIDGGEGANFPGPGFPNGGNTSETLTIDFDKIVAQKTEPYEQIKQASKAYSLTTIEPIPRWRKRPQEFVFQGKNNTLIFLGEDRSGAVDNGDDEKGQAGTIGFIVGRSRTTPLEESGKGSPAETNPRVIRNTRGDLETDKAPYRKGFSRKDNPREGNPDFQNDAGMFYLSMQTEADRKFNLKLNPAGSLALPSIDTLEGTFNRAFFLGKTDHIRLVAREDTERGVKGTILLIREGTPDQSLGYFFIDESGKIQIESSKIYFGKSVEETEPYIKWTKFKETVEKLQGQIDILRAQLTETTNISAGAMASALGNLGAPVPSLLAAQTPLQAAVKGLEPIDALKQETATAVEDSKSKKIFGE